MRERRHIYQGTSFEQRGRWVTLDQLSWIFACEHCEYRMTAAFEEGAATIRDQHVRTVHPELVVQMHWDDHFPDEESTEPVSAKPVKAKQAVKLRSSRGSAR